MLISVTVLVRHDEGCNHARPDGGGHSDAAKRLADTYNLHRSAGGRNGQVFAAAFADATSDGTLYDTRGEAVSHQHNNERRYAFIRLGEPSMTVCQAEAVMRFQRQAAELRNKFTGRDEHQGGLEVIPRLTIEGQERQLAALAGRSDIPIALGYSRE